MAKTTPTIRQPAARSGWCPLEPEMWPMKLGSEPAGSARYMMPATMNASAMTPRTTADAVRPAELPEPVEELTSPSSSLTTLPPRLFAVPCLCGVVREYVAANSTACAWLRASEGSRLRHIRRDVPVRPGERDRRSVSPHCPRRRLAGHLPPA